MTWWAWPTQGAPPRLVAVETHRKSMVHGSGPERSGLQPDASGRRPFPVPRQWDAPLPCWGKPAPRAKCGKKMPLRKLAIYVASQTDRPYCELRGQCLVGAMPMQDSPPPRPPRAVRSHQSFRWRDRLARNAWWAPPQWRVTVAGVSAFLASK